MKRDNFIFLTLGAMAITWYAMKSPQCDRGCKSNLQHLLEHELQFLLSGGRSF